MDNITVPYIPDTLDNSGQLDNGIASNFSAMDMNRNISFNGLDFEPPDVNQTISLSSGYFPSGDNPSGDNPSGDYASGDYYSGDYYGGDYYDDFGEDYWQAEVTHNIYKYLPLPMLILGVCGNILSFIVFSKKPICQSVSSIFFRALAVFDSLLLITALSRYWIKAQFGVHIGDSCSFFCRFHPYMLYWSKDLSGWILSTIAIERFLGVSRPHWNKHKFTKRRAKFILTLLLLVSLLMNITVPMMHVMQEDLEVHLENPNQTYPMICGMNPDMEAFNNNTWPYIEMFKHSIVPFTTIFLCNVGIVYLVVRASHTRKTSMNTKTPNQNLSNMTCILMTVSVVYLACSLPASIIYTLREKAYSRSDLTDQEYFKWELYAAVAVMLICTNSAINFLLYCISGPKFRRAVRNIFINDRELRRGSTRSRSFSRSTISTTNATNIYVRQLSSASTSKGSPPVYFKQLSTASTSKGSPPIYFKQLSNANGKGKNGKKSTSSF